MDLTTPTATTTHAKRAHHCLNSPNSNVSGNRRKDPKTSRACDSCRTKKIRCSGTLPCSICLRRKLTCTFDGKYGRGRPPTPQSPAERRLGQRLDNEKAVEEPSTVDASAVSSSDDTPPLRERTGLSPTADAPSLTIEGQYVGTTSNLSFLQRAWSKLSPQKHHLHSLPSDGTESLQPLASAGDISFYQNGSTADMFPNDDRARHLLSFYFNNCVVTHRILHRQTVETWLDTMLQNRAQGHPLALLVGNTKLAIILAVFAIAALRRHKIQRDSSAGLSEIDLEQSDPLFCAALQLTDSEAGFPVVESAQARLLQALYLLQTTRMNKAYYTVGNACQIIMSLGLHRRHSARRPNILSSDTSNYIAVQCSKRVFWTAYIVDKYISVVFGRPRILHDDEVDQDFPDEINDEDMDHHGPSTAEPQEESHLSSLVLHARIARIIGQTSTEVYRVGEGQATSRLATAYRMVQELHYWQGSLPAYLGAVKPTTLIASFRREATALRLAYLHALIHATRPFLLRDIGTDSDAPELEDIRAECLTAARKTLDLISNVAVDCNVIYSLWWMQYVLFCALTIVYIWEIQQHRSNPTHAHSESQSPLHDLAESCRQNILHGSSAAPLGHRYGIILEELRLEAENRSSKPTVCSGSLIQPRNSEFGLDDGANSANQQIVSNLTAEPADMAIFPSMFDDWQPMDWLDLDSSVFYPSFP